MSPHRLCTDDEAAGIGVGPADTIATMTEPSHVRVTGDELDPAALLAAVGRHDAGAQVVFVGSVRDHSDGRSGVTHLVYEAYVEHVEGRIREIVTEARERWPLLSVAVEHRIGRVGLGHPSVVVAVSSAHRGDAFAGGRYLIDELKSRAPIWKQENWPGGTEWIEGA